MARYEDLPYRTCVGMMLINAAGHYHEKYRMEDGAWRIAEVKLTRLFVGLSVRSI